MNKPRAYVHKQDWIPTTTEFERRKAEELEGLTAHPQAVIDKINRKLAEKGIMPRVRSGM